MMICKSDSGCLLPCASAGVPVPAHNAPLLGSAFHGVEYINGVLNFGGKPSFYLFNLFAEGLHWVAESFCPEHSHYLNLARATRILARQR